MSDYDADADDDDPHRDNNNNGKKKRRLNEQDEEEKEKGETDRDFYDKSKFDHLFSGLSIWLEFEENGDLDDQMKDLQLSCGSKECGVHSFLPHVTILYNVIDKKAADGTSHQVSNAEATLKECWKTFAATEESKGDGPQEEHGIVTSKEKISSHKVSASDWMYFHYPKSADSGKGFGCSISLLLIEKSSWLDRLHQVCTNAFGQGDRDKFVPHLSLVYAPEDREKLLVEYTQKQRKKGLFLNEPMAVKYLSLWSTEGRICDWRPILKIPV
ncbi:unnamed protein product [Cylindrotheca closterium]|uniref:Uncharacterized protein n=1 Tax=Cylindrotheca closterium TaxID=2856 RepID=A0AAD2CGR0_9STRA|nr:unnamed protein product [Cylindrotheca closterium]